MSRSSNRYSRRASPRTHRALLLVVVAAALGSLVEPVAAQSTRYTLSGGDVAIWNLVGSIRVEAGQASTTEVEVTRRGGDAEQLRVETGRLRGRETLRVVYPGERIVFPNDSRRRRWFGDTRLTMYVDSDGTFGDDGDRYGDRDRGNRVEIRSSGSGTEASADLRIRVPRGQRLAVYLGAGEATINNVDGDLLVDVQAADVTTSGTRGALTLDTGSGEVSVTDAEGAITVDAGSGGVTLTRVRGKSVTVDAGSGGLRGSDITADALMLDSGSGRVELHGVRSRDVQLDSGSGGVDLQLLTDVDRLTIDSGSGSVSLQVPEALGAMVTVETGSGGIDFDFPITVSRRSRTHLTGQLGDGRGRIMIDTGSGSVRFRRGS